MKRYLSIFAALMLIVTCGTSCVSANIEDTFVDYLEQINSAIQQGDFVQARMLIVETEVWYGTLSDREQLEAAAAWDKHADKLDDIYESISKYEISEGDNASEE